VLAAVVRQGQAGISLRPANANQPQQQQQQQVVGGDDQQEQGELLARPRGGGKGGKGKGMVVRACAWGLLCCAKPDRSIKAARKTVLSDK